jgi:predicted ATP-dependent protease
VGESSSLHGLSFNRAVKIESRLEHLSSDAGSLLLREAMERTGVIADLTARLHDPRDQTRIEHSLDSA